MDKVQLNQMQFYGFHGLFPEENKLGQRFYVDIELFLDLKQAGMSDRMEDSIDYGLVYEYTKEIVEGQAKNLVEAVAEQIADRLLNNFNLLDACKVRVIKPDPPIVGYYESVSVEIFREKSQ